MKILHLGIGNLGPGGVSTYVNQVVTGQRDRGHDVTVAELWPAGEAPSPAEMTISDVDSIPVLMNKIRPDILHLHSQLPYYSGIRSPTVITAHEHSAHCPAGGRYLERLGRECKKPYGPIGCLAGHFLFRCGSRNPESLIRRFEITRRVLEFRGRWITPSTYSRSKLLERGIAQDIVHLVPNPGPSIHEADQQQPGHSSEFLFVGRLVPNKGCDIAIRAVAKSPDLRLRILGDGPSRSALESLARSLGVEDRIAFEGWCGRKDVAQRMRSSVAIVVPSLWPEPFGLVALEAFAGSRPVIAARTGGLVDIVETERNGILVDAGSASQLADAMTFLLRNPSHADRMGMRGARTLLDRFSIATHLDSLERIYKLAAMDRSSPSIKDFAS